MGLFILLSILDLQVKVAEVSREKSLPVKTLRKIADTAKHHRDMYVNFLHKARHPILLFTYMMNPLFGSAFEQFLEAHEASANANTKLIQKYTKRIERLERLEKSVS